MNFGKIELDILNESSVVDTYVIYQFIKKLTTPFDEWDAFELGIIDEDGNILKSRRSLKTAEERRAFTVFDLFVLKMKKLLEKIPFGRSKLASYAAALYFIKEGNQFDDSSYLNDDELLTESFVDFFDSFDGTEEIFKTLENIINVEETPTNNIGSGNIAGVLDGSRVNKKPPLVKRKKEDEDDKLDSMERKLKGFRETRGQT